MPELEIGWAASDTLEEDKELTSKIAVFAMILLKDRGPYVQGTLRPNEKTPS